MSGSLILQPFAAAGDVTVPPQTDPSGFVNFNQGYTPFYEIALDSGNPQAKAVERPVQNALFKIATENIQAWQKLNRPEWYSTMPGGYAINAEVMRLNGSSVWIPYRSLVAGNVTDPLVSPASWAYIPLPGEMLANIPMPTGGAAGPSAQLITVATNFNTFGIGTWEFQSDAIAAGSANAPAVLGGTAAAGLLESISWLNGATSYAIQRYVDRNGVSFVRAASAGVWTAWTSTVIASNYTTDTNAGANLVSGTLPMASAIIPDNTQFWVKINGTNTGAVTFTPNPAVIAVPLAVLGQAGLALQGGELFDGGRALFVYKTDTNNFVLEFCSGGTLQVTTAAQSNQATTLAQVTAAIAAAVSGTVTASQLYFYGQL